MEFSLVNATKEPRQDAVDQLWDWGMVTLNKVTLNSKASRIPCLCLPTTGCPRDEVRARVVKVKGVRGR